MRRTSLAALLAAPFLLVFPASSPANPPSLCFSPFGGGGICLGLFSKLHQHGPLYNYGPYYGYPPFEPYGPWNAYLQYNPWYYGGGGGGGAYGWNPHIFHGKHFGHGCGGHHCFHANWLHGGWFRGLGCMGCGSHSLFHGGLFGGHGCGRCGKAHKSEGSCCTADASSATTDPLTRFAGAGNPKDSTRFYSGLPALDTPPITTANGVR